ncbi:hypothetical protein RGQ29_016176 [Quercus rubra]|uniref:Bifunctional inhibitor/plant lipid transfer protein/seed storage helical domain-containing protein n=1 Tax=Quercus rubra TaxID=3512 RepID=A0AAN7FIC7_QUERU|nr:hypothetical protein RGQ29_016176 [Quercus rubra]
MVSYAMANAAKDRPKTEECAHQLVGLATCLPYVGVLKDNKKCLCVIIRDRNDPELGLQINVTLALGLPSVCHAPAKLIDFYEIQSLLHLDPNSLEAQIFYQLGRSSNQSDGSPAPTPILMVIVGSSASAKSEGTTCQDKNEGCYGQKRWFRMETVICRALTWCFISSHLLIYHLDCHSSVTLILTTIL